MNKQEKKTKDFSLGNRRIGKCRSPLVIAEIGINHEGSVDKAIRMVDDAYKAGCECVKFQCHIIEDEMIPNEVVPANAKETIWKIIQRCQLSEREEMKLKKYVEKKGMIFLSTPFSRAAADRLNKMGVVGYKIGSGECNNYPLIEHIAKFGKPVILSTGMNDVDSIKKAVQILVEYKVSYAIMHCTSLYPTPYDKVRLGALKELEKAFPGTVLGLSDHSIGIHACIAAVALGARILEKHFVSNKTWPGPDIPISIDPYELKQLIQASRAVFKALGGKKTILREERPTIKFAYACAVSIKNIKKGELLTAYNIWLKRPGTGEIKAVDFGKLLGKRAERAIKKNSQIKWSDIYD